MTALRNAEAKAEQAIIEEAENRGADLIVSARTDAAFGNECF